MRALALETPATLVQGFRHGLEVSVPARTANPRVYAAGMGGSGIVADLARTLVASESGADLTVVRGFALPRAVGPGAHVLLTSYSGNTWETLRAYDAAGRADAARTVITSGGSLAERAEADGVPVLRVPPGLPPRAAIGHLLGGTLGVLDPLFPESNEARIAAVAARIERRIGRLASARGPPALLARSIGERLPFFYAESSFLPLARRWKHQVEENAKRLAVFDELPELMHNALVGWDATPKSAARRLAVVLLEWTEEDPTVRASARYLERLLRGRGVRTIKVPLAGEDRLEALLEGIVLGDLASLSLARQGKVDPLPVEAITRLKSTVGGAASAPSVPAPPSRPAR